MSSVLFSNAGILSKFSGCMIGSLVGDCLGAPYELGARVSERELENYFSELLSGASSQEYHYTDDTCMTLSTASSLVENGHINQKDMAEKFVSKFFIDGHLRNYGTHVRKVFRVLRDTQFEDVFLPAKSQFNGAGSYGNGAAMRIAPIALFGNNKTDSFLKQAVEDCSSLTHTHPDGYNGAILQCLAVHAALKLDSTQDLDPVDFISKLENKMKIIETKDDGSPYCKQLKEIKKLLQKQHDISAPEIAGILGNDETALYSVPTAIYSFLRGMNPLTHFECTNPFVRTIYFAISIGGDTDTIAAMAGAIAGAYYGVEGIPEELQRRCEKIDDVRILAEKLYQASEKDQP